MKNVIAAFLAMSLFSLPSLAGAKNGDILDRAFPGTDGATLSLRERMAGADYLVLTFFSATCPCQRAHDPRLVELHRDFAARGVVLLAVDAEAGSSLERDREEAARRAYPFPILSDPEGLLAEAFGARFATYTLILDRAGKVRYRGGLDTDRNRLTAGARQWAREALEALLVGKAPERGETKAFGCYLRRR